MKTQIDITTDIGPLHPEQYEGRPCPMYSYSRPSSILWDAIANGLNDAGWSETKIKHWLQSKGPRYELDGTLGDKLQALGTEHAAIILKSYK
jgi:hypothetical protein